MPAWTLEEAKEKLKLWMDALDALASAQSYKIDTGGTSRQLTRANLMDVQKQVEFWAREVERLELGGRGIRASYGVPYDG